MRSARLFAAVDFSPGEKRALGEVAAALRLQCRAGRFPHPSLLHITLHFFGQTPLDRLGAIEAAMRQAAAGARPFELATGAAGSFGRGESRVLWLGLQAGASELMALQTGLERALSERGFAREERPFRAHITVGRDVRMDGRADAAELPPVFLRVTGITLMESTQAGGRLEYVPLLRVDLQ